MSASQVDQSSRTGCSLSRLPLMLMLPLTIAAGGCAVSETYDDPVPVMLNRDKGQDRRLAAAEQARERFRDDPRRFEALHKLVWDHGHPTALRKLAIDHLIELDEDDFVSKLSRRIVLIQDWDTLDHLFRLGVERGWPNFTAIVVRNFARPAHGMRDIDRPERKVLAQLHPDKPIDAVVFEVFARRDDAVDITQQVAAWELLNRLSTTGQLLARLSDAPDATPLVVDLKASARDLKTLPRTKEGVLRLQHLRAPVHRPFWNAARARVAQLTPEQQRGLELRHIPALLALDESTLAKDRDTLLAELLGQLEHAEHHLKSPRYDGGNRDHPQRLREARDQLTWADLATIRLLTGLLNDPAAAAALFDHADNDHADTGTEYGGVIDVKRPRNEERGTRSEERPDDSPSSLLSPLSSPDSPPRFAVRRYTPMIRVHDLKFIPSQKMVEDLYTSLAHYHFHAQDYDNSFFAGPGLGDLDFADRMEATCVVFTFIDRDRLNIDYYQPVRVVVDLGTLKR